MSTIHHEPTVSPPEHALEPPKAAHIIRTEPGESAQAKVTEARILGTPVEAMCGVVFVPSQDATKLPVCEQCKEIYGMERSFNEHLHESPKDA